MAFVPEYSRISGVGLKVLGGELLALSILGMLKRLYVTKENLLEYVAIPVQTHFTNARSHSYHSDLPTRRLPLVQWAPSGFMDQTVIVSKNILETKNARKIKKNDLFVDHSGI